VYTYRFTEAISISDQTNFIQIKNSHSNKLEMS